MVMASETTILELSDIKAYRLRCRNCEGAVVIVPSLGSDALPDRCPLCYVNWPMREGINRFPAPHLRLMGAIKELLNSEEVSVSVQFEVDTPRAGA